MAQEGVEIILYKDMEFLYYAAMTDLLYHFMFSITVNSIIVMI